MTGGEVDMTEGEAAQEGKFLSCKKSFPLARLHVSVVTLTCSVIQWKSLAQL